ncbi:hypothetical protein L1987_32591 [Smallanthus sonchifolius]|uniref:Uncharacterized protein n=1 Tax=Smallanthus sonchifolius TaxID=185202 RepID=A0ACB9HPZ4_9ASTR|nr:hypothetical protein L1987_32591 [Smallanthus sonchifolius]
MIYSDAISFLCLVETIPKEIFRVCRTRRRLWIQENVVPKAEAVVLECCCTIVLHYSPGLHNLLIKLQITSSPQITHALQFFISCFFVNTVDVVVVFTAKVVVVVVFVDDVVVVAAVELTCLEGYYHKGKSSMPNDDDARNNNDDAVSENVHASDEIVYEADFVAGFEAPILEANVNTVDEDVAVVVEDDGYVVIIEDASDEFEHVQVDKDNEGYDLDFNTLQPDTSNHEIENISNEAICQMM